MILNYFLAWIFLTKLSVCQGESWYLLELVVDKITTTDTDYDDYEDSGYYEEYSGSGEDYDYNYEYGENSGYGEQYEYETKYYYIPFCKKHQEQFKITFWFLILYLSQSLVDVDPKIVLKIFWIDNNFELNPRASSLFLLTDMKTQSLSMCLRSLVKHLVWKRRLEDQ